MNWLELRKQTRVSETKGQLQCDWWTKDVQRFNLKGFKERVVDLGDIQIDQYCPSRLHHHFLQKGKGLNSFIADGTAGQFDQNFPEGYYGALEDAPFILKAIYLKPQAK